MATSIQLTPEDEKQLELLVSRTRRSKDFHLREIIERGLEDLEDYHLASRRTESPQKRVGKVHTASEVRKTLALDD